MLGTHLASAREQRLLSATWDSAMEIQKLPGLPAATIQGIQIYEKMVVNTSDCRRVNQQVDLHLLHVQHILLNQNLVKLQVSQLEG